MMKASPTTKWSAASSILVAKPAREPTKVKERIYVNFDIEVKRFARLIRLFWPQHYLTLLGVIQKSGFCQELPRMHRSCNPL
jgi:hypothetical protein